MMLAFNDAAILAPDVLAQHISTDTAYGLSTLEIARRRKLFGPNAIPHKKKTVGEILLRQFTSPFTYLLAIAATVAILTGEYTDATMIGLFTLINTCLGFFQEYRAEQAVQVLLKYWEIKTHALRDGAVRLIAAHELVPGDIIRLQAGDKIPADVRFITVNNITVDESILTGESVEVRKETAALTAAPKEYYEATNIGFSGTAVLTGDASAIVIATGKSAAVGEIATLTATTKNVSTFEKEIAVFSAFILKLVIVTLSLMFIVNVMLKGFGRLEELILFSIALTVGVIPEALPVVSTMALSRGAMRMAKKQVIVKRLSAINDLGSITILCTDKTGTITENIMQVAEVRASDERSCLRYALLGSSFLGEKEQQQNNAFDVALWKHSDDAMRADSKKAQKIAERPFDPVRRRNETLLESPSEGRVTVLRGAPDVVLSLVGTVPDAFTTGGWLAKQGLAGNRVIAIAVRREGANTKTISENGGYTLAGLISFHDPIKQSAFDAIKKAQTLGVQIKILTGDSKEVAGAVAERLRLIDDPLAVISSTEFEALSSEEQHQAIQKYHVFARLNPKQKFRILALLQEKNTVGFLGEGFNDAPGLKMANVGLAVQGASDIAKEAADVILLNPSLTVIFDGIEEGRRTFANTIKYLKITLASNFGNFYSVAIASFFIPYLPMLPLQILLLNLLTDVPMITIAADSVDENELRSPGKYDAKNLVLTATMLGLVSSVFDFITFALFNRYGESHLQSIWFIVSALTEIALIYSLRTTKPFWRSKRPPFSVALLTALAFLGTIVIPFTTFGHRVFHFVNPPTILLVIATSIVLAEMCTMEMAKLWFYRPRRNDGIRT